MNLLASMEKFNKVPSFIIEKTFIIIIIVIKISIANFINIKFIILMKMKKEAFIFNFKKIIIATQIYYFILSCLILKFLYSKQIF